MKFVAGLRVIVLSLLVVAAGTVQPRTIQLNEITQGKWADLLKRLGGVPSTPLVMLDSFAQNDQQNADVQDYTAQVIQDTFANFSTYTPRNQKKLIRIYKKLLTSPLLRADQRSFLQNSVLSAVEPTVQQLPAQAEAVEAKNDLVEVHNTLVQNGVSPAEISVLPVSGAAQPAVPGPVAGNNAVVGMAQPATPATPIALPMVQVAQPTVTSAPAPVVMPSAPVVNAVAVSAPIAAAPVPATQIPVAVAPVAMAQVPVAAAVQPAVLQASPAGVVAPVVAPVASVVSESTVNAITQNAQMSTAGKAVALTNLINSTTAPVDVKTSTAVAQAVQDVYNAQSAGDAAHVGGLLAAATQKPVLTQEQNNYVKSTLMPTVQQAVNNVIPTAPVAPVATVAQQAPISPTAVSFAPMNQTTVVGQQGVVMPVSNPGVVAATTAAVIPTAVQQAVPTIPTAGTTVAAAGQQMGTMSMHQDLEETMKNLYRQMQAAQGQTFDSATQGSFGAALVETFNGVVELQSYMSQLLSAAEDTPLLNDAQHKYVRDVMMPNLDQVSSATPTKSLDQVAGDASKKTLKKGKKKNQTVAGKKSGKKKLKKAAHAAASDGSMPAAADASAHDASAAPAKAKKKGKKAKKAAAHAAAHPAA